MLLDPIPFRQAIRPTSRARAQAKALRGDMSPAEFRLWGSLKGRRLGGLKFRRQMPLGSYIADFYCPAARYVVEVDGVTHAENRDHDARRDRWMREVGIEVLRISPRQLALEFDGVLQTILTTARQRIEQIELRKTDQGG